MIDLMRSVAILLAVLVIAVSFAVAGEGFCAECGQGCCARPGVIRRVATSIGRVFTRAVRLLPMVTEMREGPASGISMPAAGSLSYREVVSLRI